MNILLTQKQENQGILQKIPRRLIQHGASTLWRAGAEDKPTLCIRSTEWQEQVFEQQTLYGGEGLDSPPPPHLDLYLNGSHETEFPMLF